MFPKDINRNAKVNAHIYIEVTFSMLFVCIHIHIFCVQKEREVLTKRMAYRRSAQSSVVVFGFRSPGQSLRPCFERSSVACPPKPYLKATRNPGLHSNIYSMRTHTHAYVCIYTYRHSNIYMSGCQNYGPFLGLYYSTAPTI